jgi:hypothetical protein
MVRSRVYGIPAGYPDQNDHDTLRADPVFELVADRSPEDDHLASQPTLSRFENAAPSPSRKRDRPPGGRPSSTAVLDWEPRPGPALGDPGPRARWKPTCGHPAAPTAPAAPGPVRGRSRGSRPRQAGGKGAGPVG